MAEKLDAVGLIMADKKNAPLMWALLDTAAGEGASMWEFELACEMACSYLKAKAAGVEITELCDKQDASRDVFGEHIGSIR